MVRPLHLLLVQPATSPSPAPSSSLTPLPPGVLLSDPGQGIQSDLSQMLSPWLSLQIREYRDTVTPSQLPTISHLHLPNPSRAFVFTSRLKLINYKLTQTSLSLYLGIERLALSLTELLTHPVYPAHSEDGEGDVLPGQRVLYDLPEDGTSIGLVYHPEPTFSLGCSERTLEIPDPWGR